MSRALQSKSLAVASRCMKQNVLTLLAHFNTGKEKVLPFKQFPPFTIKYYTTFMKTDFKLVKTKGTVSIGESN